MSISKEHLIDSLRKVLCTATTTAVDANVLNNDYFKRRVLGFKAEIEFEKVISSYSNEHKFLEGGQCISKRLDGKNDCKNKFFYTTIDFRDPSDYLPIYNKVSSWDEVDEMFYFKINNSDWERTDFEIKNSEGINEVTSILKPKYIFYSYDKSSKSFKQSKSQDFSVILHHFNKPTRKVSLFKLRGENQFKYFEEYDIDTLLKIYATRFFLDNIMRQAQGKQFIDFDGFIVKEDKVVLVEIKEKSPIKKDDDTSTWQYGWDSRRLLWYLYLFKKINLDVLYNVRQIDDRSTRNFVQWDSVFISDFLKGVSWNSSRGGGGGEDTLLAPYLYFKRLSEILKSI